MLIKEEGGKINFIDENDNFVGFDYVSCCCENFGYSFLNPSDEELIIPDGQETKILEGYIFDVTKEPECPEDVDGYDCGGEVRFELTHKDTGDKIYLMLYNSHNGYYSHGWSTSFGCDGYL